MRSPLGVPRRTVQRMDGTDTPPIADRRRGAVVGLLCGAVAIGAAELVAAAIDRAASPVAAVGASAVDLSPEWLKGFAIRVFGQADKMVLLIGIAVVLAAIAAGLGAASRRRRRLAIGGLVVLGAIGVAAAVTRPGAGPEAAVPAPPGTAPGPVAFVPL